MLVIFLYEEANKIILNNYYFNYKLYINNCYEKKISINTSSSMSLSPRSSRSSFVSCDNDSGNDLRRFSLNSNDCNDSKLQVKI